MLYNFSQAWVTVSLDRTYMHKVLNVKTLQVGFELYFGLCSYSLDLDFLKGISV